MINQKLFIFIAFFTLLTSAKITNRSNGYFTGKVGGVPSSISRVLVGGCGGGWDGALSGV